MNSEIKQKWLDALRSGEYNQTAGALHNKNGFCCLGVLCDIVKDDLNLEWDFEEQKVLDAYSIDSNVSHLPIVVAEYVELYSVSPLCKTSYYGDIKYIDIAVINDRGASFSEIANIIEEQF